jgi:hypothetical protein
MSHPAPKLGGGSPFPTNYLLGSLSFKLERCIEDDETNQSQNKEVDPTNKQTKSLQASYCKRYDC